MIILIMAAKEKAFPKVPTTLRPSVADPIICDNSSDIGWQHVYLLPMHMSDMSSLGVLWLNGH